MSRIYRIKIIGFFPALCCGTEAHTCRFWQITKLFHSQFTKVSFAFSWVKIRIVHQFHKNRQSTREDIHTQCPHRYHRSRREFLCIRVLECRKRKKRVVLRSVLVTRSLWSKRISMVPVCVYLYKSRCLVPIRIHRGICTQSFRWCFRRFACTVDLDPCIRPRLQKTCAHKSKPKFLVATRYSWGLSTPDAVHSELPCPNELAKTTCELLQPKTAEPTNSTAVEIRQTSRQNNVEELCDPKNVFIEKAVATKVIFQDKLDRPEKIPSVRKWESAWSRRNTKSTLGPNTFHQALSGKKTRKFTIACPQVRTHCVPCGAVARITSCCILTNLAAFITVDVAFVHIWKPSGQKSLKQNHKKTGIHCQSRKFELAFLTLFTSPERRAGALCFEQGLARAWRFRFTGSTVLA